MFSAVLNASGRSARIAVTLGAGVWGLYWIPLRALDAAGITGAWAVVVFYLLPVVIWAPVAVVRRRELAAGGWGVWLSGGLVALSFVFYAGSLIFTEVVRALLLFYLTPVWSTILARIMLGEPFTRQRLAAFGLGFAGLIVILGVDQGPPIPINTGDWFALLSGLLWAFAAVRLRSDTVNHAEEMVFPYFVLGTAIALLACAIPDGRTGPVPELDAVIGVLPWLLPVMLVMVVPAAFFVIWGTRQIDAGLVGLLFMAEISVGTISAALFAGEPFGWREIIGVLLISSAGLLEAVWPKRR